MMRNLLRLFLISLSVGTLYAQDTPARPDEPMRVSSGVMLARILKKVDPIFPAGVNCSGSFVARAIVDKTGQIRDLKILLGRPSVREITANAVRQCIFRPYLVNGNPVEVETNIVLNIDCSGGS
jgi:hypothetical protein